MQDRYKDKYKVSSSRLENWDYGSNGLYFVTICTQDRVHYFGEIEKMNSETEIWETQNSETQSIASLLATEIGEVAFSNWLQIPTFHPYVELDEFVIMQDHLHAD